MFDLLIKNGLIIDGTGNPGFFGSVGIKDNTVTIVRSDSGQKAKKTIDATNRVVSPGFIDVHAHSALMILNDPDHLPNCLLYTSPSPRDLSTSRMPSSA